MDSKFIIKICLKSPDSVIFAEFIWKNKDIIIMRNAMYEESPTVYLSLSVNLSYIKSITTVSEEEFVKYKKTVMESPGNEGYFSNCACKEINDEMKINNVINTEIKTENISDIYRPNIQKFVGTVQIDDKIEINNSKSCVENICQDAPLDESAKEVETVKEATSEDLKILEENIKVLDINQDRETSEPKTRPWDEFREMTQSQDAQASADKIKMRIWHNKDQNWKNKKDDKNVLQGVPNRQFDKTKRPDPQKYGTDSVTMTTKRDYIVTYKGKKYADLRIMMSTIQENMKKCNDDKEDWGIKGDGTAIEKGKKIFHSGKSKFNNRKFF
ncbi:uncharacterized protein VNE69_12112 [Vairimorpha necatrix]|uniref:Uncharacterized protein n=1 Tax=Vairimorpha necatrix TaxID=6039 RepID=A0AAX4JGP9_9MICR